MDQLIQLLIWVVIFGAVAYTMLWICTKFLGEFPPARWICGVALLIALLYWLSRVIESGVPVVYKR
jgi:hypothetical protein